MLRSVAMLRDFGWRFSECVVDPIFIFAFRTGCGRAAAMPLDCAFLYGRACPYYGVGAHSINAR